MYTVARGREGVRNTSGFTQKSQARGGAHLGLHCNHRVPQVGTSQPEVWSRRERVQELDGVRAHDGQGKGHRPESCERSLSLITGAGRAGSGVEGWGIIRK